MTLLGAFSAGLGENSAPSSKERSSTCTRCLHWGKLWPERDSDLLLVTQQAPESLSQAAPISVGHLASGGGVCCSHLPSSARQILISTSGLPLLALPWRPLWICPRQTFLHGLSAQVQSPREWGTPGTALGRKGNYWIPGLPWAGSRMLERGRHLTQDSEEKRGRGVHQVLMDS